MKINVERGAFLKALGHVQSVVERRNTIPILSNVLIEAAKGRLKLTATDLDIEIVESIPADVLRNGAATAPAHMLYDIVRKMPDRTDALRHFHRGDPILSERDLSACSQRRQAGELKGGCDRRAPVGALRAGSPGGSQRHSWGHRTAQDRGRAAPPARRCRRRHRD